MLSRLGFAPAVASSQAWQQYLEDEDANETASRRAKRKRRVRGATLRRVAAYMAPYWFEFSIMVGLIVAGAYVEQQIPLIYQRMLDDALPSNDVDTMMQLGMEMIFLLLGGSSLHFLQGLLSARAGQGVSNRLRLQLYGHLQRLPMSFFTDNKTGEFVTLFNHELAAAQASISLTLPQAIHNAATVIFVFHTIYRLDSHLAMISICIVPLFQIPARIVGSRLREMKKRDLAHKAEMNESIKDALSVQGILLVKTFGRQDLAYRRFFEASERNRATSMQKDVLTTSFFQLLSLSVSLGSAVIYVVGSFIAMKDTIPMGVAMSFIASINRLFGPLTDLSNLHVEVASTSYCFQRLFTYLDQPADDDARPELLRMTDTTGQVVFDRVSFRYPQPKVVAETDADHQAPAGDQDPKDPSEQPWTLDDVSITLKAGSMTAIVGRNGAGKTTLTYLLLRLYKPNEGEIRIDGHNIEHVTGKSLNEHLGLLTQETYLVHDTIRENLLFGKPEATEAEIEDACRAANVHDFILSLPHGYDTVVGERATRLSGGERQRLAIARLLLKNPKIVILDEYSAHLDAHSEALVALALEKLLAGRTSLVIAHRLSTIAAADNIVVLDRGSVVEQGTHDDLLQRDDGVYKSFVEKQYGAPAAVVDAVGVDE